MEFLMEWDRAGLLAVNGWHNAFQDAFWWLVSAKWSSLLMALALAWLLWLRNHRHALLTIAMVALALIVADQLASGLIKQMVERLRPTHDPSMESIVHVVNDYRGGIYGFVSSHAANFFAASTFLSLMMRHRLVTVSLFTWSLLQCYSRVYLGVHYPGDILGGVCVGLLVGWLVWRLMRWIQHRWHLPEGHYTRRDAMVVACSLVVTIIALLTATVLHMPA